MNILTFDAHGILQDKQSTYAKNRLRYSLARFEHRINWATLRFSIDKNCERVRCHVKVSVEGPGIVSVRRSSDSSDEAISLAVDAVEAKVARRVDWRTWFDSETIASWRASVSHPLSWLFGFDNYSSRRRKSALTQSQQILRLGKTRRVPFGPHFRIGVSQAKTLAN